MDARQEIIFKVTTDSVRLFEVTDIALYQPSPQAFSAWSHPTVDDDTTPSQTSHGQGARGNAWPLGCTCTCHVQNFCLVRTMLKIAWQLISTLFSNQKVSLELQTVNKFLSLFSCAPTSKACLGASFSSVFMCPRAYPGCHRFWSSNKHSLRHETPCRKQINLWSPGLT